jgi:hypothetical protein
VKIDAKTKLGEPIDKSIFLDLYSSFEAVFPHFPQNYEFKVIYEQCLLTTKDLSTAYSLQKLSAFTEKCSQPFSNIVSQINSDYTILASAKASPTA